MTIADTSTERVQIDDAEHVYDKNSSIDSRTFKDTQECLDNTYATPTVSNYQTSSIENYYQIPKDNYNLASKSLSDVSVDSDKYSEGKPKPIRTEYLLAHD